MTKTLLVDTNRASYPIYQHLCALGHDVTVIGAKPDEPLAKISPHYINMNYADEAALAALIEQEKFDHLIPGCTDVSYNVCAVVNGGRYGGLDTPENTFKINNKQAFRNVAAEIGLSVPHVLSVSEAANTKYIIIKPTDAFSGRGIQVLQGGDTARIKRALEAAKKASKTGNTLIEEFIDGQLYSHSAFIRAQKIITDVFVREDCIAHPFAVDASFVANNPPQKIIDTIRTEIENLAQHLGLVDGIVHTQFIAKDDQFRIIEITRRCPGDLYSLLIQLSTDYPYAAHYAAPFIGQSAQSANRLERKKHIIRHTVTAPEETTFWGLRFSRPVRIRLMIPLATAGDTLAPAPLGRAAIFFFETESEQDLNAIYEDLLNGSLYTFE